MLLMFCNHTSTQCCVVVVVVVVGYYSKVRKSCPVYSLLYLFIFHRLILSRVRRSWSKSQQTWQGQGALHSSPVHHRDTFRDTHKYIMNLDRIINLIPNLRVFGLSKETRVSWRKPLVTMGFEYLYTKMRVEPAISGVIISITVLPSTLIFNIET